MTGAGAPPQVYRDARTRAAYAEGAGIYRVIPAGVALPAGAGELAALIRWAGRTGTALVPRGAGSGMAGGNVGGDNAIVVDLGRLDGARVTVDPSARTATAAAGASLGRVNEAASAHRLRVPPDPASERWATAGGLVATNAAGARSYRYGSIRSWVREVTLVSADGEAIRLRRGVEADREAQAVRRFAARVAPVLRAKADLIGRRFPQTRKNAAGYALDAWLRSGDLLDLIVGSEGTLGIVTEVTFGLDRVPPARGALRVTLSDDDALAAALQVLAATEAAAVELLDRTFLAVVAGTLPPGERARAAGAGSILLVEFEGAEDEVETAVRDAAERLASLASEVERGLGETAFQRLWVIRHAASPILARQGPHRRSLQIIEDGCVPPARLPEYLAALRRIPEAYGVPLVLFGHAGDGHVHVNLLPDTTVPGWERTVEAVFEDASAALLALGGTPAGEHGAGRLRARLLERLYGAEVIELFRLIKGAFDPRGIFNPGVILPPPGPAAAGPFEDLKVGVGATPIPADIEAALRRIEREGRYDVSRLTLAAPAAG